MTFFIILNDRKRKQESEAKAAQTNLSKSRKQRSKSQTDLANIEESTHTQPKRKRFSLHSINLKRNSDSLKKETFTQIFAFNKTKKFNKLHEGTPSHSFNDSNGDGVKHPSTLTLTTTHSIEKFENIQMDSNETLNTETEALQHTQTQNSIENIDKNPSALMALRSLSSATPEIESDEKGKYALSPSNEVTNEVCKKNKSLRNAAIMR